MTQPQSMVQYAITHTRAEVLAFYAGGIQALEQMAAAMAEAGETVGARCCANGAQALRKAKVAALAYNADPEMADLD